MYMLLLMRARFAEKSHVIYCKTVKTVQNCTTKKTGRSGRFYAVMMMSPGRGLV